jgi:GNAT superfamily N-acetyltransferase
VSAVTVRRAVAADHGVLARLLSDMQAHYRSPDPPGGAQEMAQLLTPVLYGGAYQWLLFLKDLYVTEQARGLGIGRALLVAMARIAVDRLGVPRHDKPFFRPSGDDLRKFAAG